jgi:hypothetical protein
MAAASKVMPKKGQKLLICALSGRVQNKARERKIKPERS